MNREQLETKAWDCETWPDWLHDIVEKTNEVADRLDMSAEQAHAYAVLAALSAPKAEAVTVKSLVWDAPMESSYGATVIGLRYYVYLNSDDGLWHMYSEGYQPVNGEFATSEEAKAAAQADFEARILSAITTSPIPALTDEAVERACATEGCSNGANVHFVRGDIGSWYCHSCYTKVQALAAFPSKGEAE